MECSKFNWRGIWHTNSEGGTRSSKKLASSVRQGLNGKLLAEEGIGHTNCELHRFFFFFFDRGTDIKLWKKFKKVSKIGEERGRALPGGPLVFQAGYHSCKTTFKTHPKHILFRYENRPKYAFLHAFFLICVSCPLQNLSIWPKAYLFFSNFARFCTPKWYTRVHCLHGPEKQP